MTKGYVDSDGHVMINERELNEFIEEPFTKWGYLTKSRMMPSLDEFHTPNRIPPRIGTFDWAVGPKEWLEFLEKTGIESAALLRSSTQNTEPLPKKLPELYFSARPSGRMSPS